MRDLTCPEQVSCLTPLRGLSGSLVVTGAGVVTQPPRPGRAVMGRLLSDLGASPLGRAHPRVPEAR